eukprot:2804451-Amphidinium_carterae.1
MIRHTSHQTTSDCMTLSSHGSELPMTTIQTNAGKHQTHTVPMVMLCASTGSSQSFVAVKFFKIATLGLCNASGQACNPARSDPQGVKCNVHEGCPHKTNCFIGFYSGLPLLKPKPTCFEVEDDVRSLSHISSTSPVQMLLNQNNNPV